MHRILASTIGALLALTSCMRQQPEERVHKLLTDRIQTLATAESCTGGTIAARFTAMPGASAYFKCGVVTYSLDAKQNFVNICCDTIARYGAVSEQVVRQMPKASVIWQMHTTLSPRQGSQAPRAAPPNTRSVRYGSPSVRPCAPRPG